MKPATIHEWDVPFEFEVTDPGERLPLVEVIQHPDPAARNVFLVACPRGQHRAGLVAHEGHLIYRMHVHRSVTGRMHVCSASLRAVHELPPPTRPDVSCGCRKGTNP